MKRWQRITAAVVIGWAALAAAAAVWVRRSQTPYNPGDAIQGLTSALERDLPPD